MVFQKVTFNRLFPSSGNHFGFETEGRRFFDITVPGRPRIEQGMTVIALLETPNGFRGNGLLGWIDCRDDSIACDNPKKYFCWFLLYVYFALMFPQRAYAVIASPKIADWVALIVASMFSTLALVFLFDSVKALIVKNALIAVSEFSKTS